MLDVYMCLTTPPAHSPNTTVPPRVSHLQETGIVREAAFRHIEIASIVEVKSLFDPVTIGRLPGRLMGRSSL